MRWAAQQLFERAQLERESGKITLEEYLELLLAFPQEEKIVTAIREAWAELKDKQRGR